MNLEQNINAYPLLMSSLGDTVRIVEHKNTGQILQRLNDIGFNIGSLITIIQKNANGGLIILKNNCRMAIDASLASKIFVSLHQDAWNSKLNYNSCRSNCAECKKH